jgi:hypothetical protein
VLGDVHGLQLAVANVSLGDISGAQIGVVDFAKGRIDGLQLATVSIAGGSLSGAQIGVANLLGGSVEGNQTAVVNLAGGEVNGAQVGVVNVANGHLDGAQVGVANIVNGDVNGTQIGVVNYADTSDYPIGVVSIVRNGRTTADAWVTETGMGMAGVRHGGRVLYNIYGVGARGFSPTAWAMALGIGGRAELAPKLHLDLEAIAYWVQQKEPFIKEAQISSLGGNIGYDISSVFGVFGGPTYNVLVTQDPDLLDVKPAWGSSSLYDSDSVQVRGWPGAAIGIRASL